MKIGIDITTRKAEITNLTLSDLVDFGIALGIAATDSHLNKNYQESLTSLRNQFDNAMSEYKDIR